MNVPSIDGDVASRTPEEVKWLAANLIKNNGDLRAMVRSHRAMYYLVRAVLEESRRLEQAKTSDELLLELPRFANTLNQLRAVEAIQLAAAWLEEEL